MKISCRVIAGYIIFISGFFLGPELAPAQESLFKEQNGENRSLVQERLGLEDFSELVSQISGAVVNISAEGEVLTDEQEEEIPFPFFRGEPNQPTRSLGSGFIIHPDGYIVTNNHVIGTDSSEIKVRISEEREEYVAEVIGRDDKTDLALIKIETERKLPILPLGDSDELKVGEWVLAIGNQFQLGQTVTAGIVSAKSRRIPTPASGPYDQFIQTDASINPGSSGGPLVNSSGEVVGINTAIFSPGRQQFGSGSGFNIGIGFSIPVNLAKGILQQLYQSGEVTRGLLGVVVQSITPDLVEALGLDKSGGALVADVMKESAASRAGFKVEDIIVSFDGKAVQDHDDLPLMVANTVVGKVVSVEVIRDGKKITLHPRITEYSNIEQTDSTNEIVVKGDRLGLIVSAIDPALADKLEDAEFSGVMVQEVEEDSPAHKGGIQKGDIIHQLNREKLKGPEHYSSILPELPKDKAILVMVRRAEGTRFLTVRLQ